MKKKTVNGIIAVVMAALLLAGCNHTPETPDNPTTASKGTTVSSSSTTGTQGTSAPTTQTTTIPTTGNQPTEHVHSWKDATCTDPRICTVCGAEEGRAAGHQWDAGVVTKDATEETDGEKKYTCTVCGEIELRIIPAKNHVHNYDQIIVTQPNCTEKGYTTHTCRCGDSYTDSEVKEKGHDWENATCNDPKTCKVCGTTEGSAKGHSYNSVVTPPTETEKGYTTHTCINCSDSYVDSYTDPVKPTIKEGTLVFSTDGIARLYGKNEQVAKTYTGWDTAKYTASSRTPWYNDRQDITAVIIEDGVSPKHTDYWFYYCNNMTGVSIGNGVTSIGDMAFHMTWINSVTIPNSVTSIGDAAFNQCTQLTDVNIGDGVTTIGMSAFYDCQKLTRLTFGKHVASIGETAFADCAKLTSIAIDSGNTVYHVAGNCLIETASKTLVLGCGTSVIPSDGSVTSVGEYAFYGNTVLTSITVPDKVTNIGIGAFYNCKNLSNVTIGKGVVKVDAHAFASTGLVSVNIPDNVKFIGSRSFNGCHSLTAVTIGKGVNDIDHSAFSQCSKLTALVVDPQNDVYHSDGNCIIETASKTLIAGCNSSVIPTDGSVTSIDYEAFLGCTGLTSVMIPKSVVTLGDYAFCDCSSLASIEYSGTVEEWNSITKWNEWNWGIAATYVQCTNGRVDL